MRYLIIGSGGREHALAWKLAGEEGAEVFVAPGSAGMETTPGVSRVQLRADQHDALLQFAKGHQIDLTVVGPEAPLCAGLADQFRANGLDILGPGAGAALLEGSKAFAKEVMSAAGVPTARYDVFDVVDDAIENVRSATHPLVIKADGLAGGKGVVISANAAQSEATLRTFMDDRRFGDSSARVVIEECLVGPELSFMVITDGHGVVSLSTSRDHKRLLDGDLGPNTGGMGAITPSPDTSRALEQELIQTVIRPTLAELERRGLPYRGFLYAGLMLTADGPKVLEFNVRLGDPETQVLLLAMDADLGPVLHAAARGELRNGTLTTDRCACCVVLAAKGYPLSPERGAVIEGLATTGPDAQVFHAGTERDATHWISAGGRVLGVVARAESPHQARARAYELARDIQWDGMQMRSDIGDV